MKVQIPHLALLLLGSLALNTTAATRYVDLNNASPTPPYTSWSTAATNINDAIDAAVTNDLILVTNGVYQSGGRVVIGTLTNRVAITKPVTVSSINGPVFTIIQGAFDPVSTNGDGAVRCAHLVSGAVLAGFTITNGATQQDKEVWLMQTHGGGVWCESTNAMVTNCVITGNAAFALGGGVFGGTTKNCVLRGNTARADGGGAYGGQLVAGVYKANLVNCLVYGNWAGSGGGASQCTLTNCTVTANGTYPPTGPGSGFDAGAAYCISYNCIIYYNTNANGDTLSANYSGYGDQLTHCCTTPLPTSGFNITVAPLFVDAQNGNVHLLPNSPCIDVGTNSYAPPGFDLDGNPRIIGGNVDMGAFEFPVAHVPTTLYVDVSGTNPISPYTNWATAATVLQDAADISQTGDEILVAAGVYKTGGRLMGGMTNRVVLIRSVSLRSVHGPAATIIEGYQVPETVYGENAVRCAYLANGAALIGFTLTNGATQGPFANSRDAGAGVWCLSTSEVVSNCVIVNNRANRIAGGIYQGTVHNSIISSNSSVYAGGGASSSVLNNCVVQGNYTAGYGGGVEGGVLRNCLLFENSGDSGGGASGASLTNCTVSVNAASFAGGVYYCAIENCIVFGNTASDFPSHYGGTANYCCIDLLPGGVGNFTNAPLFVDPSSYNFRLQTNSPCIDSGNNTYVSSDVDLDGRQRIQGSVVDIGAYEFQGAGMGEFIGWLQGFGLATDGSTDFTDADGDKMNNYSEWRADTNPTNTLSLLRMISATNGAGGTLVTWQSVATRNYWLERSSDLGLASPFQTIATNVAGAASAKTFTDTSATNNGPYFYRVGVE